MRIYPKALVRLRYTATPSYKQVGRVVLAAACRARGSSQLAQLAASMPRSLPHLDIAVWRSDPSRFARQLRLACHHDGFLQLRHRIPTPLVEHVKSEARNFFAQDAEHKHAIDYRGSPAFRGYMACGVENTAGRPDLREQVEIAAEGELALTLTLTLILTLTLTLTLT